jgi:hypothetical protein
MSDFDTDFEDVQKRCNFCNKFTKLSVGKPYCSRCEDRMYRECRRCKKPFDDAKYFSLDQTRCDACFRKLQAEKVRRQEKKRQAVKEVEAPPEKKTRPAVEECTQPQHVLPSIFPSLPTEMTKDSKYGFIPIIFPSGK